LRRLGRTRRAAGHDIVDLIGIYGFPFEQRRRHRFDLIAILFQNFARHIVLLVDNAANRGIYLLHGGFRDVRSFGDAAA
jgi:hypothetical protein